MRLNSVFCGDSSNITKSVDIELKRCIKQSYTCTLDKVTSQLRNNSNFQ